MKITTEAARRWIVHLVCDRCGREDKRTIGYDFAQHKEARKEIRKDYWQGWHFWNDLTICSTCLVHKMRPLVLLKQEEQCGWKQMRDLTLEVIEKEIKSEVSPNRRAEI